jgi:hypothetical protein
MRPSTSIRRLALTLALAAFSAAVISGCATGASQVKPIPAYVPAAAATAQSTPDQITLTFFRNSGVMGRMVDYILLVDGMEVARVASGRLVRLPITEGPHTLEVKHPHSFFGASGESMQVTAAKGQPLIIEVVSALGRIRLMAAEVIPFSVTEGP